jgi:hypothetical protein
MTHEVFRVSNSPYREPEGSGVTCDCGHSDRMHVRGVSPRYAGCMVRLILPPRRAITCPCTKTPEQVRAAVVEAGTAPATRP